MKTIADELIEEGWQKGWHEGQAKGLAEAVLRLLATRGLIVDETTRVRILACKDLGLLNRWFEQALNAKSLLELENL
jgi:flagellar biosynthesis/type III secretory pathway protein FliH